MPDPCELLEPSAVEHGDRLWQELSDGLERFEVASRCFRGPLYKNGSRSIPLFK